MRLFLLAALLAVLAVAVSTSSPASASPGAGIPLDFPAAQQSCAAWDLSRTSWEIVADWGGHSPRFLLSIEEQRGSQLSGAHYGWDADRRAYVSPLSVSVSITGNEITFDATRTQHWWGALTSETTMKGTIQQERDAYSPAGSYSWEATARAPSGARCVSAAPPADPAPPAPPPAPDPPTPPECRDTPLTRVLDNLILDPSELSWAVRDAKESDKPKEDKVFDTGLLMKAALAYEIALGNVGGDMGSWRRRPEKDRPIVWPATLVFLTELRYRDGTPVYPTLWWGLPVITEMLKRSEAEPDYELAAARLMQRLITLDRAARCMGLDPISPPRPQSGS